MPEANPRVSIGIPVYNGAEFLPRALDSIIAQTFESLEILISDNASDDETAAICARYAAIDDRIRYERSDRNRGAAWNYNRVVEMARGEYFKWAAHDDWIDPTYVEQCVQELDADESVALVYGRTILVLEDAAQQAAYGGHHVRYEDRMDTRHPDPVARFCHVAKHLDLCNAVFGVFRLPLLRATGLIRPFSGSDVLLLSEISLQGEIHELSDFLFYRRRHSRASRLENRSRRAVAQWFSTDTSSPKATWLTPGRRLFWEHMKVMSQARLSPTTRLRGVVRFALTRAIRRVRVVGGRYKQRLRGERRSTRAAGVVASESE